MIRFLLYLALVAASGPAAALSCLKPSAAGSTAEAIASEDTYRIVVGRFDFVPPELPADVTARKDHALRARFEGRMLTADGFTTDLEGDVLLRFGCAGAWCGSLEPGADTLAYLLREDGHWALDVGACPKWVFADPTEDQLDAVRSCVAGECPAE